MPFLIGIAIALATALVAAWIGFERRTFYATLLLVVGHYYVLFAVMGGSSRALVIELSVMTLFVLLAAIGFRKGMWIVALGLAAHGAFDFVHGALVANPGVPTYWPAFCAGFDVMAALVLVWLGRRSVGPSEPQLSPRL